MIGLRKFSLLALVLLIGVGIFYLRKIGMPGAKTQEDHSKVGSVTTGDIIQRVTVSGTIAPWRTTEIKPPYDGYVQKVFVKVGEKVKPGAPIVTIAESLSIASDPGFPIRAPLGGEVVAVNVNEGQNVTKAGSSFDGTSAFLVRIDDTSELYAMVDMPELEYAKVEMGDKATIRAGAILGKTYKGTVMQMALASKAQERWGQKKVEFPVKIRLDDPDRNLKSGMSVIIDIITARKDKVLTLRHEFIEKRNNDYFVTKKTGEKVKVVLGLQDEMAAEIVSGVQDGEQVQMIDFLAI
ncbi:MAG: efflux RND transporter periplasmic adaptor subunit [Oligoflexales bacterium]